MEQPNKQETPLEINNRLFNKFYSAVFNSIHKERRNIEQNIYYYENIDKVKESNKKSRQKAIAKKKEAEKDYVIKYADIIIKARTEKRSSQEYKEAEAKRMREYRKNNKEKVAERNKAYNEKMKLDPTSRYKTEEYKAQERERAKANYIKKKNLQVSN